MSDYKIKSENVTFGKIGETVTEKDLKKLGVNIDALVEGGHLAASRATTKKDGE
jgi:hypothetical protein